MDSYDAGNPLNGLCEPPPPPWPGSPATPSDRPGRSFAALSHMAFSSRYASWKGVSGKSYVFTVYSWPDCPAFCDAIVLAVSRNARGERRILSAFDTGPFPEPVLARAQSDLVRRGRTLEFHVHLLAREASERRAALADLEAGPARFVAPDAR